MLHKGRSEGSPSGVGFLNMPQIYEDSINKIIAYPTVDLEGTTSYIFSNVIRADDDHVQAIRLDVPEFIEIPMSRLQDCIVLGPYEVYRAFLTTGYAKWVGGLVQDSQEMDYHPIVELTKFRLPIVRVQCFRAPEGTLSWRPIFKSVRISELMGSSLGPQQWVPATSEDIQEFKDLKKRFQSPDDEKVSSGSSKGLFETLLEEN